jgi:hypothetical protein
MGDSRNRVEQLVTIQSEAMQLFRKKNMDYGDAFAAHGIVGILVRVGDKIHRLQNITANGITLVEDEKLRDTLLDLHNYAAMGIMLLNKNKDTSSPMLEDNVPVVKEWSVKGDRGIYYDRQYSEDKNGKGTHTCSCPSFAYCTLDTKTCKHIERDLDLKNTE